MFVDLHSKIDVIINKYLNLERHLQRQRKSSFKCKKCYKKFENLKELQKHKNEEFPCHANFKCDKCEKRIKSEDQLTIHKKKNMDNLTVKNVT